MPKTVFICLSLLVSSIFPFTGVAAPPGGIEPVTLTPTLLPPDQPTSLTVTATIAHPKVVHESIILQELVDDQWEEVGHLTQDPSDPTQFSLTLTRTEPPGIALQFRVSAAFRGQLRRGLSSVLTVPIATRAEPQEETTIVDPFNPDIQLILPSDALTTPVYAAVTTQEPEALTVDLAGRTPDLVLDVTLQPEGISPDTVLTHPYQLNVPAPADAPEGTRFNVAVPILADAPEGGGLREQLLAVDTAIVENGHLLTRATELEGLFYTGTVLFLRELGSGIATGQVVDEFGTARPGVFVYAQILNADDTPAIGASNPYVFLTDVQGNYRLPIDPTNPPPTPKFQVQAIDGQRCGRGNSPPVFVPDNGAEVTIPDAIQVKLPEDASPLPDALNSLKNDLPPTRVGISNGGFEVGAQSLGATGCNIGTFNASTDSPAPSEGSLAANSAIDYSVFITPMAQNILVPKNAQTLSFDYAQLSALAPESQILFGYVTQDPGTVFTESPNFASADFDDIPSAVFQTGTMDVSSFSGSQDPVSLLFFHKCVSCIYDPYVARYYGWGLIDNIRFGTVFVDVKILDGSMAELPSDTARVARLRKQVIDTNEILAQVGVNVRLRRVVTATQAFDERGDPLSTHPCPGFLTEPSLLDIAYASDIEEGNDLPTPNAQLHDLLGRCRSTTATDVNVYFVNILRETPDDEVAPVTAEENPHTKYGLAIGADDYHLDGTPGPGLIIRNMQNLDTTPVLKADREREVLAHELGHLLIGGVRAGQPLEHDTLGGNLMTDNRCARPEETNVNPVPCSSRAILTPEQSEQIHATNGGGFLVD